jgi:hypothetical protein
MPLGPVIARRELARVGSSRPVMVEIGKPRRRRTGEWACPYRIRGLGHAAVKHAYGEDAVQALQLAFDGVRVHLEPHGTRLSWVGEAGFTGFPRFVPYSFGRAFSRRVERFIERELRTQLRVRRARAPVRSRRRKRSKRAAA